jgi:hypothetical protein
MSLCTEEEARVERFNWRDLIEAKPDTAESIIAALDAYFVPFAAPPMDRAEDGKVSIIDNHPCLNCGEEQTGLTAQMLGSGFTWGIAHGEGFCGNCKWPARLYHFIKDANGNEVTTIRGFLLQYHPDFVEKSGDPS